MAHDFYYDAKVWIEAKTNDVVYGARSSNGEYFNSSTCQLRLRGTKPTGYVTVNLSRIALECRYGMEYYAKCNDIK